MKNSLQAVLTLSQVSSCCPSWSWPTVSQLRSKSEFYGCLWQSPPDIRRCPQENVPREITGWNSGGVFWCWRVSWQLGNNWKLQTCRHLEGWKALNIRNFVLVLAARACQKLVFWASILDIFQHRLARFLWFPLCRWSLLDHPPLWLLLPHCHNH